MSYKSLFIIVVISVFFSSCLESDLSLHAEENLYVEATVTSYIYTDVDNLEDELIESVFVFGASTAHVSYLDRNITISEDLTSATATINFKEEYEDIYTDPDMSNNSVSVMLIASE